MIKDNKAIPKNLNRKFLGINLAIQRPTAIEKAPINIPTLTGETPNQIAIPAAAPAPMVQSGQCAKTAFDQIKETKEAKTNRFNRYFID